MKFRNNVAVLAVALLVVPSAFGISSNLPSINLSRYVPTRVAKFFNPKQESPSFTARAKARTKRAFNTTADYTKRGWNATVDCTKNTFNSAKARTKSAYNASKVRAKDAYNASYNAVVNNPGKAVLGSLGVATVVAGVYYLWNQYKQPKNELNSAENNEAGVRKEQPKKAAPFNPRAITRRVCRNNKCK